MVPRHEILRECLARFETRRGRSGTEQQPAVVRKPVGDAEAEREFRSDDGEVDLFAGGERRDRIDIRRVDSDRSDEPRNARISWCGDDTGGVDFV